MRIVVLDDYQGVAEGYADWAKLGVDIEFRRHHIAGEDELVASLAGVEVVVAMRERTAFPRSVLERLSDLKLLVTTGPYNASFDLDACEELGIATSGTGGTLQPTAELTWGLILGAMRHIPAERDSVRSGGWQTTVGEGLHGKRLGILGLGWQGSQVARIGVAFGMDVVAWSQNLTAERCAQEGIALSTKDELLATSDVVTIHLVLSDRTRGLIGEAELQRMKRTALLVNTSRGPIVDEDALVRALRDDTIRGAALDVFAVEPLPADHPFRTLPNVLVSPHIGYVTDETYRIFYGEAVEDIEAWLAGSPIRPLFRKF